MARPKLQDQQRARLAAAARQAITTHGLANVRVRDIADAAAMSPGTVTYYYRQIDDLFRQVYDEAVDRFHHRRTAAVEAIPDPPGKLLAAIDTGLPTGPEDELCCLLYEFGPQARRRRDDADLRRDLYQRQVEIYRHLLVHGQAQGDFVLATAADEAAHNLVALEDAYGYHIIARTTVSRTQARQHLIGYATLVTGIELSAHDSPPPSA